jgi:hypothetical protein
MGCGTLEKKTILSNVGDCKERILDVMGPPQDRQVNGQQEAWQYCISGAVLARQRWGVPAERVATAHIGQDLRNRSVIPEIWHASLVAGPDLAYMIESLCSSHPPADPL